MSRALQRTQVLLNSRAVVVGGRTKGFPESGVFVNEIELTSKGDISATRLGVVSISSGSKHGIEGVQVEKEVRWDVSAIRDDRGAGSEV